MHLTGKYQTPLLLTIITLIRETGAYMSNLVPPKRELSKFHNAADVKVDKTLIYFISLMQIRLVNRP